MEGVQSYDCSLWHPGCPGVELRESAGFFYLWCPTHKHLANMQAVSPKHKSWQAAGVLEAKAQVAKAREAV